jgi:uncharacterized delta-60 repeat protein
MSLYKFLDQERTPVCTAVSFLTTVAIEAVMLVVVQSLPRAGLGGILFIPLTGVLLLAGITINIAAGIEARRRGEYWGGRIAVGGIALWFVTIFGFIALSRYRADEEELARTWGQSGEIGDVIVQRDGKLVLLGAGIVRLLPDGRQDTSFPRDYSFAKGGSLPGPLRDHWPIGACAATLPNGDLLFAANGWIGRVFSDGRDGPDLSAGPPSAATCWGMAVQPDGSVLTGWVLGPGRNRFSRNLPDGSKDPQFYPAVAPLPGPGAIAVQDTGKILLVGWVQSLDEFIVSPTQWDTGARLTNLTCLNRDGTLDESFHFAQRCRSKNDPAWGFGAFAVLSDGSMLVAPNINRNGRESSEVLHVDSSGIEIRRSPLRDALQRFLIVSAIVPTSDGRILVVGRRNLAGGATVARLLENGTPDPTFHVRGFPFVRKICLQGEKILVLEGIGSGRLQRLNSDGSSDPTFQVPLLKVYSH